MFISIVILWRIIQEDFLLLSTTSDKSLIIERNEITDTQQLTNNNLKQIKKQQ